MARYLGPNRVTADGALKVMVAQDIEAFQPHAGVERTWSKFMQPVFGQPLNVWKLGWMTEAKSMGDIVITHYGLSKADL